MRVISRVNSHRVLTTEQAAKVLGLSNRTLEDWRMHRRGPIYLRQIGSNNRQVYYLPEHIEEFARTLHPRVPSKSKTKKRK